MGMPYRDLTKDSNEKPLKHIFIEQHVLTLSGIAKKEFRTQQKLATCLIMGMSY